MSTNESTLSSGRCADAVSAVEQTTKYLSRLNVQDHRRLVVDYNGQGMLDLLDKLAAEIADAREAQRMAMFDLGY